MYHCYSKGSEKFPARVNGVVTSNVNHTSEISVQSSVIRNVRMFVDNGKPWFCATDIASSSLLGYVKLQDATQSIVNQPG